MRGFERERARKKEKRHHCAVCALGNARARTKEHVSNGGGQTRTALPGIIAARVEVRAFRSAAAAAAPPRAASPGEASAEPGESHPPGGKGGSFYFFFWRGKKKKRQTST